MQERARHITQSRLDTKNSDGPPGKPGECKGKLAGLCTCDPFIEHSRNDAATEMEAGIRGGRGGEEPPSGVQEAVGMEQLYTGIDLTQLKAHNRGARCLCVSSSGLCKRVSRWPLFLVPSSRAGPA